MNVRKIIGVILAGGIGSRMGNVDKPKQFLELGGKPIIIHTIEKFIINPRFDYLVVLTPRQWVKHTQDIICKNGLALDRIHVIEGGETRNDTIMNAIEFVEKSGDLTDETIIVTHDSVRPFVTHRILEENIDAALQYGACDTVIPATDTIVESENGTSITDIPNRKKMYQGQTPQSFKAKKLKEIYSSLNETEKQILTDACKILTLKGEEVHLVSGEVYNIKITYPYDLKVGQSLLGGAEIC